MIRGNQNRPLGDEVFFTRDAQSKKTPENSPGRHPTKPIDPFHGNDAGETSSPRPRNQGPIPVQGENPEAPPATLFKLN
jgi:hypothetical protein